MSLCRSRRLISSLPSLGERSGLVQHESLMLHNFSILTRGQKRIVPETMGEMRGRNRSVWCFAMVYQVRVVTRALGPLFYRLVISNMKMNQKCKELTSKAMVFDTRANARPSTGL